MSRRILVTLCAVAVLFVEITQCTMQEKVKISKCCDSNEHVGVLSKSQTKECIKGNSGSFDSITVFDSERVSKSKNFDSAFNIIPGKFKSNATFKISAINTILFKGFNKYLSENGKFYFEIPNAYTRWLEYTDFCIDYFTTSTKKTSLQYWIVSDPAPEPKDDTYMTAAMFVSSFFLLAVLVVYSVLKELRNLCGLILMAYVASLLTAVFLLGILRTGSRSGDVCYALTLIIYFSFLASFCWMNVMSYDIWWTFRGYAKARPIHRRGQPFKYCMYSLYAWGLPLALTVMLVIIDKQDLRHKPWIVKPNLQKNGRFIEGGEKLYYLYFPMLILICLNWLFFLMTAFNIWRLSRGTSVLDSAAAGTPAAHRSNKHRFLVYLKLTVVMGLNWILEVVSYLLPNFSFWYISDIYNVLIGVFIFFIFVFKKNILRKLTKVFLNCKNKGAFSGITRRDTSTSESSSNSAGSTETETLKICTNPKGPGYIISNNF